jgi:L-threonylcarbamoyladenylate synthase
MDGQSRLVKISPSATKVTTSVRLAADYLRAGGVVAFPTETVYGLGANALNAKAVQAIFRAKGRPSDNPLIVHLTDLTLIGQVARRIPASAEKLMAVFFPGPLTVIVPKHRALPLEVTAGLDTVGIRCPGHPVAAAFLTACGTPVAAPSANRSGRPSPTTWSAVVEEMDGRIPCILKGGAARVGLESTVVDCTTARPIVLRQGGVTVEALREVIPSIRLISTNAGGDEPARSPGMKYRHYAPKPTVVLVESAADIPVKRGQRWGYIGCSDKGIRAKPDRACLVPEVPTYAQKLFHFFRVCERAGVQVIYCQKIPERGLGRALMDRLRRAASDHPTHSTA